MVEHGEQMAAATADFKLKQSAMLHTMATLSDDIRMKEAVVVRQHNKLEGLRKFYESKMHEMNKQVRKTMKERDKLLTDIQKLGSTVQAEKKELQKKLHKKLKTTEKQLQALQAKQRGFDKLKRMEMKAKRRVQERERKA